MEEITNIGSGHTKANTLLTQLTLQTNEENVNFQTKPHIISCLRWFAQTICGNHNIIVTLSFNHPSSPLHNVAMTQHENYDDNLH